MLNEHRNTPPSTLNYLDRDEEKDL
jgi:hypothetical protein